MSGLFGESAFSSCSKRFKRALLCLLRDHHHFLMLCMKLLSIHLSLAHAGGTGAMVLGAQGRPLRHLLFRLIDTNMPDSIHQVSIFLLNCIKAVVLFDVYCSICCGKKITLYLVSKAEVLIFMWWYEVWCDNLILALVVVHLSHFFVWFPGSFGHSVYWCIAAAASSQGKNRAAPVSSSSGTPEFKCSLQRAGTLIPIRTKCIFSTSLDCIRES